MSSDWATLIRDMLGEIRARVDVTVRARMRRVCAAWRAADVAFVSPPWTYKLPKMYSLRGTARKCWVHLCACLAELRWPVLNAPHAIYKRGLAGILIRWDPHYYDGLPSLDQCRNPYTFLEVRPDSQHGTVFRLVCITNTHEEEDVVSLRDILVKRGDLPP